MRLVTKMSLVAVAVITLAACQKEAELKPVQLDTDAAKQAYSLGVSAGRYLGVAQDEYGKIGVALDQKLVLRGVQDAIAENIALTDEELQTVMQALDQQYQDKKIAMLEAEAIENVAAGSAYLAENATKEGVTVTESGLQYEVLEQGEGEKPVATDVVKVHYSGTLTDGTKFDSSYDRGEPAQFPLNRVITGWTEGVQLMPIGSKYKFTIPADLAYGEQDKGVIKPNSVLVFEVELLDIVKPNQD